MNTTNPGITKKLHRNRSWYICVSYYNQIFQMYKKLFLLVGNARQISSIESLVLEPSLCRDADDVLQAHRVLSGNGGAPVHNLVDLLAATAEQVSHLLRQKPLILDPLLQVLTGSDRVIGSRHEPSFP